MIKIEKGKCPYCGAEKKINIDNPLREPLTHTQKQYYFFIWDYMMKYVVPPTIREIATQHNVHIKAVRDTLDRIKKKGYIEIIPHTARGIRLK